MKPLVFEFPSATVAYDFAFYASIVEAATVEHRVVTVQATCDIEGCREDAKRLGGVEYTEGAR